jgi:hypothetical protein
MGKTYEDKENEKFIRLQAEQARSWQQAITVDEDLEKWVSDGHWDFLERRVFADVEREAFQTIKNPAFDPANLSQVAQLKALCQVMDLLRIKVSSRVQSVKDARTKLQDLENTTLKEGV